MLARSSGSIADLSMEYPYDVIILEGIGSAAVFLLILVMLDKFLFHQVCTSKNI
jgi:hypothetical protein